MLKKIFIVISIVSILLAFFAVSASAGVTGDVPADAGITRYLPWTVSFVDRFTYASGGENEQIWYQFATLTNVFNSEYGLQQRQTYFGSEDYRQNIAQFTMYRSFDAFQFELDAPIRYIPSIDYDFRMPEYRSGDIRLFNIDGLAPVSTDGVYISLTFDVGLIFNDGNTWSHQYTMDVPVYWSETGYYNIVVREQDYTIDSVLGDLDDIYFNSNGGLYAVSRIQVRGQIYEEVEGVKTNYSVVSLENDTYTGYAFVRPVTASLESSLYSFQDARVVFQNASSRFNWIGTALNGFFSAPLFVLDGFQLTIGALFFAIIAVFGVFFILRAFAGG